MMMMIMMIPPPLFQVATSLPRYTLRVVCRRSRVEVMPVAPTAHQSKAKSGHNPGIILPPPRTKIWERSGIMPQT